MFNLHNQHRYGGAVRRSRDPEEAVQAQLFVSERQAFLRGSSFVLSSISATDLHPMSEPPGRTRMRKLKVVLSPPNVL